MSKATVLLVGAEDGLCSRGRRVFADPEKFEIQTCTSATEVVTAVQESSPDVVLVDLAMPSFAGVDVLNELRKKELIRFVPLAVLGRDEGIAWRAELFKNGVADIIDEKADDDELRRRVSALLEGRPWGAGEVGDDPAGPAVAAIAELEREKKTARLGLSCGEDSGEIVLEKGVVTSVNAAAHTGEEALNLLAGSPGWQAAPRMEPGDPPPSRPSQRVPVVGEPRVLLVDDDRTVLRLFEIFLGRHGYRIMTASSGREGLAEARREPPDVIISDVIMPDGDGWWLLTKLRQDFLLRDTPCLFFSNKGPSPNAIEELGVKPDRYLDKDPHLNNVTRALEETLAPARKLYARLNDQESGTVQGKVDDIGVMPLLRMLRTAKRSGRLVLTSAPGQTAVLGLRDDVLTSAKLSGKERADGTDALGRVVAGEWGSFRFEPNLQDPGTDEIGPADKLLREACERNQRFFEIVKIHALAATGGVEKDPVLADRYRAAAPPKLSPIVRAVVRGESAEAIARSTGMELPLVEHALFEMMRRGVFKLPGMGRPTPIPSSALRESVRVAAAAAASAAAAIKGVETGAAASAAPATEGGAAPGIPPASAPPGATAEKAPAPKPLALKSPLLPRPLPFKSPPGATPAPGTKLPLPGLPVPRPPGLSKAPSKPVAIGPPAKDAPVGDDDVKTNELRPPGAPPAGSAQESALPPLPKAAAGEGASHEAGGGPPSLTSLLDPETLDPDLVHEDLREMAQATNKLAKVRKPPLPSGSSDDELPPLPPPPLLPSDESTGPILLRETPQPVPMASSPPLAGGRSWRVPAIAAAAVTLVIGIIVVGVGMGNGDGDTETGAPTTAPRTGADPRGSSGRTTDTAEPATGDAETSEPETAAARTSEPETDGPETAAPKSTEPRTAVAVVTSEPRTAKEPKEPRTAKEPKEPRTAKEPKEPRTAKAADPAAARAFFDEGNKLFLKGSKAGAVAAFKKAAKADPTYPDPHRGLALTYASMSNKTAATRSLDAYLRLRPGAKDAAYVRKKIDEL